MGARMRGTDNRCEEQTMGARDEGRTDNGYKSGRQCKKQTSVLIFKLFTKILFKRAANHITLCTQQATHTTTNKQIKIEKL